MCQFRALSLVLTIAAAVIVVPAANAAESEEGLTGPPGVSSDKVLVVGMDGVRHDKLLEADTPNLDALAETGLSAPSWLYTPPMAPTSSGPGWASIASGVWPDKHNVTSNDFPNHDLATYPDFLTRLEQVDSRFSTYSATDWGPLGKHTGGGPVFSDAIDVKLAFEAGSEGGYAAGDQRIADTSAEYLRTQDPDAAFVYFGNPDIAGHDFGAADPRYLDSIETADRQLGQLLRAVRDRGTHDDERWLIMVTTDHGHTDAGGHGGSSRAERNSFVIANGPGIPAGEPDLDPRVVDLQPTVLAHLGVAVDPRWNLDGRPLGEPSDDPFDTLIGDLKPAVDETAIPADRLGWTRRPPAEWAVVNADGMPQGVTEWQGWSFTTDDFWTSADPVQGRENFVRGRGVVAVADSDEWNDKGSPSDSGTFDSTLFSAPYAVAGKGAVNLRFASHYRQDGAQKASVSVAFDGGPAREVLAYGPEPAAGNEGADVVSKRENVEVTVPDGARRMVVSWRLYDAGDNWYWAIDEPEVVDCGGPVLTMTAEPSKVEPGSTFELTQTVRNPCRSAARDVRLGLRLPDGWSSAADGPTTIETLPSGKTLRRTHTVTIPEDTATCGDVSITGQADYTYRTEPGVSTDRVRLQLSPSFDGMLLGEDFESLRPTLKPRVDESGIPADLLGWTHSGPAGWTVENAAAMPQGMTEWQGWSFATREFWTAADTQLREAFDKATGIIAIADPDEWDDKGAPSRTGKFDSTLTTEAIELPTGQSRVYVGMASHYRQFADQKAEITAVFDGGTRTPVLTYGPAATDDNAGADVPDAFVNEEVEVPAGATSMRLEFRMHDAGNDWFWAFDNLRISPEPITAEC